MNIPPAQCQSQKTALDRPSSKSLWVSPDVPHGIVSLTPDMSAKRECEEKSTMTKQTVERNDRNVT